MPLKTLPKLVKVSSVRLLTKLTAENHICFDQNRFVVEEVSALSPVAVNLLLELLPIIVIAQTKDKLYQVVFGSRLFEIVAKTFEPSADISVHVIQEVNKKAVDRLRYLDLAVIPVMQTLSLSAADTYELINVPVLRCESDSNLDPPSALKGNPPENLTD